MTKHLFALLLLSSTFLFSQENTEVYLMDIHPAYSGLEVYNMQNISENPGYDNQPHFIDNHTLVFAGSNKEQTDISVHHIPSQKKSFFNSPTAGGEYSPAPMFDSENITAVRLDPDGKQRLYAYSKSGKSKVLIPNLQVAYYAFKDKNTLLASVLDGDGLDLVVANLQTKQVDTLKYNAGRSIHKVPNTKKTMSYTFLNEDGNYDVYQLNMENLESFFVAQLPIGIQDHIWLSESQLLIGSGDKLFIYDLFGNGEWHEAADLSEYNISNITRLAVSPNGKKLAIVAEPK
ncbi:hypothetical protein [Marixanthomonas spongiae]|uniref:WD40 repeat domain-containing protein n=1 Tax=Marixanthomonas spongiae TaxID=2174845 RepID=A0A2U0I0R1_9FLAO|nr:hypothetical protein [Marixanthomonas spongiae]PVW14688.1 hypothetical protein DDV96_09220 [Marixanthomonas spongiae]